MSEGRAAYSAAALGSCDVCLWYGVERQATQVRSSKRYPRSFMADRTQPDPTKPTARERVIVPYQLCDDHAELCDDESMQAAMRRHRKDCDTFTAQRGQLSLIPD